VFLSIIMNAAVGWLMHPERRLAYFERNLTSIISKKKDTYRPQCRRPVLRRHQNVRTLSTNLP
jgi:hypothetical protein